jgi:hypothetical protein
MATKTMLFYQKYEVGMQYLDKAVFYKDKNGFL